MRFKGRPREGEGEQGVAARLPLPHREMKEEEEKKRIKDHLSHLHLFP
jgi:hypothetical protein